MTNELSLQNDSIRDKVRTMIINGQKIKDIQEQMGINAGTWDANYYRNTNGFRDFIVNAHNERLKKIARQNIEDIISMSVPDDDVRYLKIKADMTAFVAETIDKENFSKKTDEDKDSRTPINIQLNTYERIKKLKKG
jgi:cupin superfamily acireductone dioxygenase involved in methionine salvage